MIPDRQAARAVLVAALLSSVSANVFAQEATRDEVAEGDIIVTARKRAESLIEVPVVITAVGGAELKSRAINNLDGIARIVPQLIIAPQGGSVQGGNISIRGIAGPDSNPFGDQAVSFNIDGVQVAKASVRRMSDIDIAQVEVLKGPQALFFGKNSPAGIVSIRTADPTPTWEGQMQLGYEFNAHEVRAEGYVSGPVSDTLGIRLAGGMSRMRGYLDEITPESAYLSPNYGHSPRSRDFALRGTAVYEPMDNFRARLKLNYGETRANGPAAVTSFIYCAKGVPQSGSIDDCKPGGSNMNPSSGPGLDKMEKFLGRNDSSYRPDGANWQKQKQFLGGLELNYEPGDGLSLTSVTGLYIVDLDQSQQYESDYAAALPSTNQLHNREFSQELRATSDFDGPINFTGGLYFSDTSARTGSHTFVFAAEESAKALFLAPGLPLGALPFRVPIQLNNYYLEQKGQAYSAFLQVRFEPLETVEIDVGGRYSYEKKRVPVVLSSGGAIGRVFSGSPPPYSIPIDPSNPAHIIDVAQDKDHWADFSPELTVSYRPSQDLTVFGSYKHGFLSGGFNSSSVGFADGVDISYDPQTVKGFELGVKAALFDRTLRIDLAGYTYKVDDLQVTNFVNATGSIRNAGAVKIKGFEASLNWRTPVHGLSTNFSAAYNDGKYSSYPNAPCYNGQTTAQGCNVAIASQDLSGTELIRAPNWNLAGGIAYDAPLNGTLKLGFSVNGRYSSSFLTDASSAPHGRMPKYGLLDATLRLAEVNDKWEVALIGRNLTNKYYWVQSTDAPFTGGALGSGVLGDRYGALSRGREIMLRVTYGFGK